MSIKGYYIENSAHFSLFFNYFFYTFHIFRRQILLYLCAFEFLFHIFECIKTLHTELDFCTYLIVPQPKRIKILRLSLLLPVLGYVFLQLMITSFLLVFFFCSLSHCSFSFLSATAITTVSSSYFILLRLWPPIKKSLQVFWFKLYCIKYQLYQIIVSAKHCIF